MQIHNSFELQAEMAYRQENLRRSAGHRHDRRHRRESAHRPVGPATDERTGSVSA